MMMFPVDVNEVGRTDGRDETLVFNAVNTYTHTRRLYSGGATKYGNATCVGIA